MGEVWRARDHRLGRDVAIKTLPEEFATDKERLELLGREARFLAALNHPNIASIHGIEEDHGRLFLVMELVEGQTLADLLQSRGALGIDQALRLAAQVADALESAHAKGVVHRDLKPANIKLTADGHVKVLDFGLAKAIGGAETGAASSGAPTVVAGTTTSGTFLGTPAYMSPEQVRGGPVDKRTDLWAYGCVLFELLTGKPAFGGATTTDICAEVLRSEPDWSLLPAATPPSVRRLLRRCLRKDAERRIRDIGDVQLELEEREEPEAAPARPARSALAVAAWPAAIVVGAAILGLTSPLFRETALQEFRFELGTTVTDVPASFAVSPDGRNVTFVGQSADGASRLWISEIGSLSQRELVGTDRAEWPFWSPDGNSVAFYADGALKEFDLTTQGVRVLTDLGAQSFLGAAWSADDVLLFPVSYTSPIFMVRMGPQGPRDYKPVTEVDLSRQIGHAFPHFLPDGNHFLYFVNGTSELFTGTYLGSLDGSVSKRLLQSDSTAVYSEPGRLLFMRGTTLFAQSFDLETLALSGEAFAVTDTPVANRLGSGGVSASTEGTIVYRPSSRSGQRQFVWRNQQGNELARVGEPFDAGATSPELTANSDGIVFHRFFGANRDLDLWLLEFSRGAPSRITFESANEWHAIVSPVDDTLVYADYSLGADRRPTQLYTKSLASNTARGKPLLETQVNTRPLGYSPDGRTILYASLWSPAIADLPIADLLKTPAHWDVWALKMDGSGETFPVASSEADEWAAQFSPDQNWIAFESNESGIVEVYIQSYPDGAVKKKASSTGGAQPRWFRDGNEQYLYFISLDRMLYRVQVVAGTERNQVALSAPQQLFLMNVGDVAPQNYTNKQQYVIDRQGRILSSEAIASSEPLRVIKGWAGQPGREQP
jgi:Tol biopolymer transport system component